MSIHACSKGASLVVKNSKSGHSLPIYHASLTYDPQIMTHEDQAAMEP